MSGTISWWKTRDQRVKGGRLVTVSGLVTLPAMGPYNGRDVGFALNERLREAAGVERKAWGPSSHTFGRMRCEPFDVLQISASVFISGEGVNGAPTGGAE